jgi:hypothetical protein
MEVMGPGVSACDLVRSDAAQVAGSGAFCGRSCGCLLGCTQLHHSPSPATHMP